jgi:hypothetical protein
MMLTAQAAQFSVGRTLEIEFDDFSPCIAFHPDQRLTVQITAGDNAGFSETVKYEAIWFSDSILVLSWVERLGNSVVHVLDLESADAYALVTTEKGGFTRLQGRIKGDSSLRDRAARVSDATPVRAH